MNYKETIRFEKTWVLLLLGLITLCLFITIILQVFFKLPVGNNPIPNEVFLIFLGVLALLYWFYFKSFLTLQIDALGISYKIPPFQYNMKKIFWVEIESIKIQPTQILKRHGGWGYRFKLNSFNEKTIVLDTNFCIHIILNDRHELFLSTKKPNQAKQIIDYYEHYRNT